MYIFKKSPSSKYAGIFRDCLGDWVVILLLSTIINFLGLLTPIFSMLMYDKVIGKGNFETLVTLTVGMLFFLCLEVLVRVIRCYVVGKIASLTLFKFEGLFIDKLLGMKASNLRNSSSLMAKYRDFISAKESFISGKGVYLADLPFLLIFLLLMWYIGDVLVVIPVIVYIPVFVMHFFCSKRHRHIHSAWKERNILKYNKLSELIIKLPYLQLSENKGSTVYKYEENIFDCLMLRNQQVFWESMLGIISAMAIGTASLLLLAIGALQIESGKLTIGGLIACSLIQFRAMNIFTSIVSAFFSLQEVLTEKENIIDIINEDQSERKDYNYLKLPETGVTVSVISLSCECENKKYKILADVNYSIERGQRIALIGKPGSGKTTLLKCIAGISKHNSGRVLIEGLCVDNMSNSIRSSLISYKAQDLVLIGNTIDEVFHNLDVDRVDFVSGLTGLKRNIENGLLGDCSEIIAPSISAGQKQILSITRSLSSDVALYLIDEPTTGLDADSEMRVINAIDSMTKGKTVIIATHSKEVLKLMDKALVLDNGRISSVIERDNLVNL
ncbi:TPA: ATP-binding cassette domain-containing protein [Enterobacter roggenkampii]